MNRMFIIGTILLGVALFATAEGGFVYVASPDGAEIVAIDVDDGTTASIVLSHGGVASIFPTPGGKFVFVTYRDTDQISIVDAGDMTETRVFSLAEGRAERILFTPMGHGAYVTLAADGAIAVYGHSRSELTYQRTFEKGAAGAPILFNRRGTRFYRGTSSGLSYYLETTHEEIKRVRHRVGPAAWGFTDDFRFLWGVGLESGEAFVLDERRGRVAGTVDGRYAPLSPVLSADSAFLVDRDGTSVVKIGIRNRKVVASVALPEKIHGFVGDDAGSLWVATEGGMVRINQDTLVITPASATVDSPGALAFGAFKPGEGFACF